MEKKPRKNNTEYNTEYMRNKRGSTRKQERTGSILENGERLTVIIPKEHKEQLKQIALSQEKGVNQLLRELIEQFLSGK